MASRIENILTAILNDGTYEDEPQSRIEAILLAILNQTAYTAEAQSRIEAILLCILNGTDLGIVPQSRVETILECIYRGEVYTGDTQSRIEELLKQISEKEPTPSTFTATFVRADGDGGGTLYTQTDVPVGTVPVYGGETPTTTKGSAADYPFKGWTPALAPIAEDTTYTAVFGLAGETIDDDWSTILANPNYATDYSIGDTKAIDLGTEGMYLMKIVAIDADERADGNGKAGITWISEKLLYTIRQMNPARMGRSAPYTEGTGSIGGWDKSLMKSYLLSTIAPLVPAVVRDGIVPVKKYSCIYNTNGQPVNDVETSETLWIPSLFEVCPNNSDYSKETQGVSYSMAFPDASSRKKESTYLTTYYAWWTRTAQYGTSYSVITSDGEPNYESSNARAAGIALGFCTN